MRGEAGVVVGAGLVLFGVLSLLAWRSSVPPGTKQAQVIAVQPVSEKLPEKFAEQPFVVVGVPEPEPPTAAEDAVAAAVARTRTSGGALTAGEMLLMLAWTGWPIEWWDEAVVIGYCESRWSPGAVGDGGASLGLMQVWDGWFVAGEDPFDPLTNLRAALRVRTIRGRFGESGGWSCADLNGIP